MEDSCVGISRNDPTHMIRVRGGRLLCVTACVFALGVAACSSSSKSAPATPPTGASGSTAAQSSGAPSTASTSGDANFDACTLLSAAKVSTLAGHVYTDPKPQTIANGQDQCTYKNSAPSVDLVIIVYQSKSGVTFDVLKSVQAGVGAVTDVSGVGDKAFAGLIELDIQVGDRLVAVEGAGGSGNSVESIAIGKAIVAALG